MSDWVVPAVFGMYTLVREATEGYVYLPHWMR